MGDINREWASYSNLKAGKHHTMGITMGYLQTFIDIWEYDWTFADILGKTPLTGPRVMFVDCFQNTFNIVLSTINRTEPSWKSMGHFGP